MGSGPHREDARALMSLLYACGVDERAGREAGEAAERAGREAAARGGTPRRGRGGFTLSAFDMEIYCLEG